MGDRKVAVLWTERADRDLGRAIAFAEERSGRAAVYWPGVNRTLWLAG